MDSRGLRNRRWVWFDIVLWACVPLALFVGLRLWPNTGSSTPPEDGVTISNSPHVLIFGDSISLIASPAVNAALGKSYALKTRAVAGEPLHGLSSVLEQRLALRRPQAVIIELGSDAALYGDASWKQELDAILTDVDAIPCVALVTVSPLMDYAFTRTTHQPARNIAAGWNVVLKAAVRRNPQFHLVDWGTAATTAPDFVYDGVHPNNKGSAWLIAQYRDVLDKQCHLAGGS